MSKALDFLTGYALTDAVKQSMNVTDEAMVEAPIGVANKAMNDTMRLIAKYNSGMVGHLKVHSEVPQRFAKLAKALTLKYKTAKDKPIAGTGTATDKLVADNVSSKISEIIEGVGTVTVTWDIGRDNKVDKENARQLKHANDDNKVRLTGSLDVNLRFFNTTKLKIYTVKQALANNKYVKGKIPEDAEKLANDKIAKGELSQKSKKDFVDKTIVKMESELLWTEDKLPDLESKYWLKVGKIS